MKSLLDVCADSLPLRNALPTLGQELMSARERCPQASDETLLMLVLNEGRVLATEDKDCGEHVFPRGFRILASHVLVE